MFGRRALAGTVLATTLLTACGGGDETDAQPVATPEPTASAGPADGGPVITSDASPVPAALDFTAPLLDGGEIEMGRYAGRPVLLWFWAPW